MKSIRIRNIHLPTIMKQSILTLSLLSALALSSCQRDLDEVSPQSTPQSTESNSPSTPARTFLSTQGAEAGTLYIRIRRSAKNGFRALDAGGASMQSLPSQLAKSLRSIGTEYLEPLFPMDPRFEERIRREGLDLWYIVHFDKKQNLQSAMQTLSSVPEVEYTEPAYEIAQPTGKPVPVNYIGRSDAPAVPYNDPLLPDQWHYHNTGRFSRSIAGADIGLFEAWTKETGKSNVIVAVDDGGIDIKHPDLKDNLYVNQAELKGKEGVDDDNNGFVDDIYGFNFIHNNGTIYPDDESHGTHVAGTVGARTNNNIGVAGVAGGDGTEGSGVRLMSCQIFGGKNEGGSGARAMYYSANNGAVISQNSWGYVLQANITAIPQADKAAIDYFIKYAGCDKDGNQLPNSPMKGGIVIFAAGNDGMDYKSYPGAYPPVVAVASMAPNWTAAYYSNRGDWVDITAPGGDTHFPQGEVLSTLSEKITGKEYGYMQGTSMACPHVSGVAALIVSHFGKKGFTNVECQQRLLGALKAQNIDALTGYKGRMGRGYIDASAVFAENKKKAPAKIAQLHIDDVSFTTAHLSWLAVRDEDDGLPVEYNLYLSTEKITEANAKDALHTKLNATGYAPGKKITLPLNALHENTTYYLAIEAVDRWGLKSGLTLAQLTTKKNNPPVLTRSSEKKLRVSALTKESFSVTFSDPDQQKVSISVSGESRGVSYQISGDKILFSLRAVAPVGKYEITVTATDVLGAKTQLSIPFEVYTYKAPAFISSLGSHVVGIGQSTTLDVAPTLEKSDGVALIYKARVSDGSLASATINADGQLVIRGLKTGTTQVNLEVSDGISTPVQTSIPLRVVQNTSEPVYSVYPIPATTELNIVLNPATQRANIQIYSLTGVKVLDRDYTVGGIGKVKLLVKNLAPGAYTLRVQSAQGSYTKAFVKK